MRKAVTLVRSFLKLKRSKKPDSNDNENEDNKPTEPELPDITILRPCSRCILAYENKTRKPLQSVCISEESELSCAEQVQLKSYKLADGNEAEQLSRVTALLQFYGLQSRNGWENAFCTDKSCMSLQCLQGHVLWDGKCKHKFDSHFPVLIIMTEASCWQVPLYYEDSQFILLHIGLGGLCSLVSLDSKATEFSAITNTEVWVAIMKLTHQEVFIQAEDLLVVETLDNFVLMAFLNVPLTRDKRSEHLEVLFQAVDNIMDISIYLLGSGDSAELQSSVKEAIIETATIVTSTAAESTATVGIETAAMALGQAAAGVALSVLVDVAITAGTVTRAKIKRDKGLISNSEFKTTVRHKLCDSGCQFIGGTTGTIVGQVLIPVPVVGAIVGGFCGSLIGAGVSKGIIKTTEIISKAQANKTKAITNK